MRRSTRTATAALSACLLAGGLSAATAPTSATPTSARPDRATSWGPTRAEVREARKYVDDLSISELAGQVVVARYAGPGSPEKFIADRHLGGVTMFADNITSVEQIKGVNEGLQATNDRPFPLWLAVDQEGGRVARLGAPMTLFPSFMSNGAAQEPRLTRAAAKASAREVRDAGFNVAFAPDADVTAGPADPVIGSRSAGSDAGVVSQMVTAALRGYDDGGVLSSIKHFPGHGSLTVDSHLGLPRYGGTLEELRSKDYLPFEAGIEAGAPMVMIGHIDVPQLDDGTPASLSRPVITGELRERLGFEGVIVTDALEMGAIVEKYGAAEAVVKTLQAGTDVALMPADTDAAIAAIDEALRDGRLDEEQVRAGATRMVALLLHEDAQKQPRRQIGTHAKESLALSRAALTSVAGPCRGRLVGRTVEVTGQKILTDAFALAASRAGLKVAPGGTEVALLGRNDAPADADVVVTTDTPYQLGTSTATSKLATYGQGPQAMQALVEVLVGKRRAPGTLPVPVEGVTRTGC
ncbi:MAG: glycoside hydrolase family 3 N-terminal domain-containing protein [Nocardioidaceae bacterium]|nr:glycoside hydrolase family 3 N-terminal domain-containing protein [Nocardioidaceae bacterium]